MSISRWTTYVLLVGVWPLAAADRYQFDFGPAGSHVQEGYIGVTSDSVYEPALGYGFTTLPSEAETITENATVFDANRMQPWRVIDAMVDLDDRTRDYVAGGAFDFRVDLPDGVYDVVATVGHRAPLHHMRIVANGDRVADGLSVFTYNYADRGGRNEQLIGGVYRVGFATSVQGGKLLLSLSGDPEGQAKPVVLRGPQGREARFELGGPYTRSSLMSLQIAPQQRLSLVWRDARLEASPDAPPEVARTVEAFNTERLEQAQQEADKIPDANDRAYAWLAIAGHPSVDREAEARAIRRSAAILGQRLEVDAADAKAAELLEEVELFQAAVRLFHDRRTGKTEIRMIGNLHKSHSIWRQFGQSHPFHYKGLLYSARAFKGMVPFSFTPKPEYGLELMRRVEAKFPRNKYVRLYLHNEWAPPDWTLDEYPAPPGTPKWAEVLRRAYAQAIDFGEWWADNRQLDNGSIGGGWNDDVEVMPLFGLAWWVSPDASTKLGRMVERFTEGLWASENIDRRRAFSAAFFDAEHAAEDQGNSFPYLTALFYGNPRYLDWNRRTILHFRNFLTGVNENGRRHFRSHHYGSARYSLELSPSHVDDDVEAAICYRAFGPVPWMHWYNGNPVARQLLIEHADSWLAAAMSQAKGKPVGIIPSQLGFNDEIGGPSDDWRGQPGLGGGSRWPAYNHYLQNLLLSAYRASADRKYLQPFEATLDLLDGFHDASGRYQPIEDAPEGSPAWTYNQVLGASYFADSFFAIREMTGDQRYDNYIQQRGSSYLKYRLSGDKAVLIEDMETINARVRERWPFSTTDGVMTDRIAYLPQMISYMVGAPVLQGFQGFPSHAATYLNTLGEFAAVVEEADSSRLRLSYYSFWETPRSVGVRPWLLAPGGPYRLRVLARGNEIEAREFTLEERGQPVMFAVPPREEVSIEIEGLGETAPPAQPRADLALSRHDLRWNVETDQLEATIHNVGSADAYNIEVAFFHQTGGERTLLEKAVISRIGALNELQGEDVTVGSWGHRNLLREGDDVVVVIDPRHLVPEITRTNNEASFRLYLSAEDRRRMLAKRLTTHDRRNLLRRYGYAEQPTSDRPSIHFLKDLGYGADDSNLQRLDAYLIQRDEPGPAVIEFHGGGWRRGVKSVLDQYGGFPRMLIEKGISLISVDYRLTPKDTWPAQGEDALAAIRYVVGRAEEWNIDPARIALLGGSAGAHLALWAGFQSDVDVAAIIDLWGPSDFSMANARIPRGDAFTALFDCTLEEFESPGEDLSRRIRDASPITHASPDSPPVLIVHQGPSDVTSPTDPRISGPNMGAHSPAYGLRLAQHLRGLGVEHRVIIAPDAGAEFQPSALEFLSRQLGSRQ